MSGFRPVSKKTGIYARIYEAASRIPRGLVATYGQIASMVPGCTPRMAGYAMAALPFDSAVPWHRVINHKGMTSPRAWGDGQEEQRALLEAEGVIFDHRGRVDLEIYGWKE